LFPLTGCGAAAFDRVASQNSRAIWIGGSESLGADELKTLRSLIVGNADYYLKYDDDFDRSKSDLGKILDQIRQLQSSEFDPETLMHLRVLCREASSALVPTVHYLEQKERVRRFEEQLLTLWQAVGPLP